MASAGLGLVSSPVCDAAGDAGFVDGALMENEKEIVAGRRAHAAQHYTAQQHDERLGTDLDLRLEAKRQSEGGRLELDSKLHIFLDTCY